MAAKRGLDAGHEQRGGNSLAGNVGEGDTASIGAEGNEIVVVAGDGACGAADGGELQAFDLRDGLGEKLGLNFASDGDFVFEALALALLFEEAGDGGGHFVERIAEDAQLIALGDPDAVREVSATDELSGVVEIADGGGDPVGEDDAGDQSAKFNEDEGDSRGFEDESEEGAKFADGSEEALIEARGAHGESGEDGLLFGIGLGGFDAIGFESQAAGERRIEETGSFAEGAIVASNFAGEGPLVAIEVESEVAHRACTKVRLHDGELDGAQLGVERIEAGRIEWDGESDGERLVRGAKHRTGGKPKSAGGIDQAGDEAGAAFTVWILRDEAIARLDFGGEAGQVILFAGEDGDNFGALQDFLWVGSGGRGGAGCFVFGGGGDGARSRFHLLGAFLDCVVKEVGAELGVEHGEGDGGHGEEEDHRDDGDEEVGDDETVAQAPEEAFADEREKAEEKVDGGDNEKESDKAGGGGLDFEGLEDFVDDVDGKEGEADAVEPGDAAQDAQGQFKVAGHEGPF